MNCEDCKYAEWDYEEYYGTILRALLDKFIEEIEIVG